MNYVKSNELREKRARLWEEAKALQPKAGEAFTEENRAKFDKIMADVDVLKADIERVETLEAEERELAKAKEIAQPSKGESADEMVEKRKKEDEAFRNFLIHGIEGLNPEERALMQSRYKAPEGRAQTVTTSGGGYLIPQGFYDVLTESLKAFGGMRQSARVLSTATGNDLPMPTVDDTGNVGELLAINTAAAAQDFTFGQIVLKAYKYSSKYVLVPIELLQDSAINVPAYLAKALATRIGRITNTHFTTGDNSSKPQGVVTGASSGKTAAGTSTVTGDELIDLQMSIDPAYQANASWQFNFATLGIIRKLKDANGQYLWQPGLRAGEQDLLLGKPYVINQDVAAMTTGNKPVVYGDFSQYIIRDVMDITVLRLAERFAEYAQVGFLAFSRHDGRVLDAGTDPIKYLTMA